MDLNGEINGKIPNMDINKKIDIPSTEINICGKIPDLNINQHKVDVLEGDMNIKTNISDINLDGKIEKDINMPKFDVQ